MSKHEYTSQDKKVEAKKPNYLIRRLGAAVTVLTLATGAVYGADYIRDRNVNVEVPSDVMGDIRGGDFSDQELEEEFGVERITVADGDTIDRISDKYIKRHGLRLDVSDVSQVLLDQNGGSEIIRPEDEFYLADHQDR